MRDFASLESLDIDRLLFEPYGRSPSHHQSSLWRIKVCLSAIQDDIARPATTHRSRNGLSSPNPVTNADLFARVNAT